MDDDRDVRVRAATGDDAGALARLRFQWRSVERTERGDDPQGFERAFTEWMHEHEHTHLAFLAVRDTIAIGMAWLAVVDRIPGPEHFTRRSGYLQSVYVVPEARDHGVGARLVRHVIEHARALGLAYLDVRSTERAISLYRSLGFGDSVQHVHLHFDPQP
jgi:ribosomal protein S18 acetylase RimI-like enzyme